MPDQEREVIVNTGLTEEYLMARGRWYVAQLASNVDVLEKARERLAAASSSRVVHEWSHECSAEPSEWHVKLSYLGSGEPDVLFEGYGHGDVWLASVLEKDNVLYNDGCATRDRLTAVVEEGLRQFNEALRACATRDMLIAVINEGLSQFDAVLKALASAR